MVDRITEILEGKSITASKLANFQDCYMKDAITNQYYFPEALMIEALCQAGAWLVMKTTEFKKRAVLLSADSIEILGIVYPGDELVLIGNIDSLHENAAVFSGYGKVNGEIVMQINYMMCSLVDTTELENVPDTKRTFLELSSGVRV
ncbi:hypothetical protein [Paenibacillus endoradicis]|uniref:hypothetical protein n=1 Tax=Paenibacillus endoradicis TaxID=2972487 RepID=UPI00215980CD|nr:hypothetical protein [Paenibacillus endoradicis]MCR8657741.1 hypothetical protein [Paenibacillus endoradicis]